MVEPVRSLVSDLTSSSRSSSSKAPPGKDLAPGYLIYGEETYWHRKAIDLLTSDFGGERESASGDEVTWESVRDFLTQPSFFGPRLWVIRDAQVLFSSKAIPEIQAMAPGNCLVLSCPVKDNPAPKDFLGWWQRLGGLVFFGPEPGFSEASAFVTESLAGWKLKIGKNALDQLILVAGRSLERLDAEIQKLALYVGTPPSGASPALRTITPDIVTACVSDNPDKAPFAFIDAVAARDSVKSLNEWWELKNRGATAPMLLSMMANHVGLMWRAKESLQKGIPQSSLGKALGVHPYTAEKASRQSSRWSFDQMESALFRMRDVDESIKRGRSDPDRAFENLLVALGRTADL